MKNIVTKTTIYVLALLFIGSIAGCKKKDNDSGPELLIGVTWKPSAAADPNPSSNPSGAERYNWPDCALGASVKFNNNGQLTLDLGADPCTPDVFSALTVIQQTGFTYDREKKELKTALGTITIDVLHLSETHLKLGAAVPSATGYSTYIFLFEKK